jgi:uncharacterized protein YdaL
MRIENYKKYIRENGNGRIKVKNSIYSRFEPINYHKFQICALKIVFIVDFNP